MTTQHARNIAENLMKDLDGRSGFDVDVDAEVRREWLNEWVVIIMATATEES